MTVFTKPNRPFLLAVAGGSGSGKTYFAEQVQKNLGSTRCVIVPQDNFYIDQSARFDFDGGSVNFDHPDSIDHVLIAKCLSDLKMGKAVEIPLYDFSTHKRKLQTLRVEPKDVILIDGILILHWPETRVQFDQAIFFDTPESLRFERRMKRDVSERGRKPEGVREQFLKQVKPMHDQFVEPSKSHAHLVVLDPHNFDQALHEVLARFQKR